MLKKMVITFLLGMTLIISGCGSSDGEGESALATQQLLDNGEFTAVIDKLEGSANSTSDYLSLAVAYMGKAGFSLSSMLGIVVASAEAEGDSLFANFIENSNKTSSTQSLTDLKKAVDYYKEVVFDKCLEESATLSGVESDICLYVGLARVFQTSVAMSYIIDDVSTLTDINASDPKLTASICAMEYALTDLVNNTACVLSVESNVTFIQSTKTYVNINITVDGNTTFEYLISGTAIPSSTVLTSGFCTLDDFATRVNDINDTSYHVCPIDETDTTDETTSVQIFVNALNDGVSSVGAAVSDDIQADIEIFKNEILTANGKDTDEDISIEDMLKYLSDNNEGT